MSPRLRGLLALVVDIALPIGLYYVLRTTGIGDHAALLVSSLIPGLSLVSDLLRRRRPDGLSLFMTVMMLGSAAVSLLIQDTRFLLAKDGWITAVAGLWFLGTVRGDRPLALIFSRLLLEGRIGPHRESWDLLWERLPAFRRIWRVVTAIYGVGLLLDAAVRVVMAYTLPVEVVPGLGGVQYGLFLIMMQVAINLYLIPSGLYNRRSRLYLEVRT